MATLLPEERETILRFDEASSTCSVWTASRGVAARLKKAGLTPKRTDQYGW